MKAKMCVCVLVFTAVFVRVLTAQTTPVDLPGGGVNEVFSFGNAVPVLSTEARYSAGIFTNDIDNYMDVNSFDPEIGAFAFFGGYPAAPSGVADTDSMTGISNYALSLGFGKTLGSLYLGLYYGGSLVDANGHTNDGSPKIKHTEWHWRNKIALLLGTAAIGAFRLDLILDTNTGKNTSDGEITGNPGDPAASPPTFDFNSGAVTQNGPIIALTWGSRLRNGIKPYVTAGYQFYDTWKGDFTIYNTNLTGAEYHDLATLGIKGGMSYDIDESSYASGDLALAGIIGGAGEAEVPQAKLKQGGGFLGALRGSYYKKFTLGGFSFGFKPSLALGIAVTNFDDVDGYIDIIDQDIDAPSDIIFNLSGGIDVGFEYRLTRRIALYTGAGLQLFRWRTLKHDGGDIEDKSSAWDFRGLTWDDAQWAAASTPHLGFGFTVTPVNNLIIGAGLNTFLDKLVVIDLQSMQVRSGSLWGSDTNNFLSYIGQIFDKLTFDLTVSYKL